MNHLDLCKALAREAGISGSIPSVTDQAGEALRVVNWISEAYREVLNAHSDWEFLRADVTIAVGTGNRSYTAAAAGIPDFGAWRFKAVWSISLTGSGTIDEQPLIYLPYDRFRETCLFGGKREVAARPSTIAQGPDQSLLLWPLPDAQYNVYGEYFRQPVDLIKNEDVPAFAARWHRIIVHRALMLYASFEGDAGLFASAQTNYARMLEQMENSHLPEFGVCGAMA
jgi:hypothetical protein